MYTFKLQHLITNQWRRLCHQTLLKTIKKVVLINIWFHATLESKEKCPACTFSDENNWSCCFHTSSRNAASEFGCTNSSYSTSSFLDTRMWSSPVLNDESRNAMTSTRNAVVSTSVPSTSFPFPCRVPNTLRPSRAYAGASRSLNAENSWQIEFPHWHISRQAASSTCPCSSIRVVVGLSTHWWACPCVSTERWRSSCP